MIYIVEDENSIRDLMIYALSSSGFEAVGFDNSKPFWDAVKEQLPDLIMLDIMMPGEDGITILKKLKSNNDTASIPVIMSTAKGTEYDKVIGLDLGADDYLAKPFGMMEMISRVRAVLRRVKPKENPVLHNGDIELRLSEHKVYSNKDEVELTLKEYELLKLLMKNPGIVFSREQLLTNIWGMDFMGETRTVDVHIGTLRTKLGDAGGCIETVRGVGYKLRNLERQPHDKENI